MRITIIIDEFVHANAGTEHQVAMLLAGLAPKSDVEVVSFRRSPWLTENSIRLGFSTRLFLIDNFKSAHTYCNLLKLSVHLRSARTDVVHTFFPVANVFGVLAARSAGVRAVVASRRDYGEWMSPRYLWATRQANRFVDMIVANAEPVARLTESKEGVPAAKLAVIRNGIDALPFKGLQRDKNLLESLGIPASAKVVGLVANFRPMKRHETLLRAARDICRVRSDTHFLLLGKNMTPEDIEGRLRITAVEYGIADHIHFAHASDNVKTYLGLLDIAVNCSEGEGLSNAIMEYMAAGLPCVVTDSGGNPDLIRDGATGLMFELGDHAGLAARIEMLLNDPQLATRLGSAAQDWVSSRFGIDAMVNHFLGLYGSLLGGGEIGPRQYA